MTIISSYNHTILKCQILKNTRNETHNLKTEHKSPKILLVLKRTNRGPENPLPAAPRVAVRVEKPDDLHRPTGKPRPPPPIGVEKGNSRPDPCAEYVEEQECERDANQASAYQCR